MGYKGEQGYKPYVGRVSDCSPFKNVGEQGERGKFIQGGRSKDAPPSVAPFLRHYYPPRAHLLWNCPNPGQPTISQPHTSITLGCNARKKATGLNTPVAYPTYLKFDASAVSALSRSFYQPVLRLTPRGSRIRWWTQLYHLPQQP